MLFFFLIFASTADFIAQLSRFFQVTAVTMNILLKNDKKMCFKFINT